MEALIFNFLENLSGVPAFFGSDFKYSAAAKFSRQKDFHAIA